MGDGLTESTRFNSSLQPTAITLGTVLALNYTYCSSVDSITGECASSDDNGNVKTAAITRSGQTWNQSFTYDGVNRLLTAQEAGPNSTSWMQSFGYDHFANRWIAANPSGSPAEPYSPGNETPQSSSWYVNSSSQSNNQITAAGWVYDNAGNTPPLYSRRNKMP